MSGSSSKGLREIGLRLLRGLIFELVEWRGRRWAPRLSRLLDTVQGRIDEAQR